MGIWSVISTAEAEAEVPVRPPPHLEATFGPLTYRVPSVARCVVEIVGRKETYGYAITRRLNELGFADVVEGTVYTVLLRLEKNGFVQVTKRCWA